MFAMPRFFDEALIEPALGLLDGLREHLAPVALRDAGGAVACHVEGAVAELTERAEGEAGITGPNVRSLVRTGPVRPELRGTPTNTSPACLALRQYSECTLRAHSRTAAACSPRRSSGSLYRALPSPIVVTSRGEHAAPLDDDRKVGRDALALCPRRVRSLGVRAPLSAAAPRRRCRRPPWWAGRWPPRAPCRCARACRVARVSVYEPREREAGCCAGRGCQCCCLCRRR